MIAPLRSIFSFTKSWLSLAFCFLSTLQAASVDDLTFQIIEEQAVLIECDSSAAGVLTIPSSYAGFPVTRIAEGALQYCEELTEVILPDSLLSIGNRAFFGTNLDFETSGLYHYLTSANAVFIIDASAATGAVEVPATINDLTVKSANAFHANRSITSVTLPNGITEIGTNAFSNCSLLESVRLSEGITHIRPLAFQYSTNLTSVNLPESLQTIGTNAFFETGIPTNTDNNNFVFLNNGISAFIIDAPSATGAVAIPPTINGLAVKSANAFQYNNSITSVTLPEGITEIGSNAFEYCEELTSVTLPTTLTHIGDNAFGSCSNLTDLPLPENLLSIGDSAFSSTKLAILEIGAAVSGIGDRFIEGADELTSIEVDASNSAYQSFDGILYNKAGDILIRCPLGRSAPVVIPDEVTLISPNAFRKCAALREVQFGTAVRDIGEDAFFSCSSLSTVLLNSGLETIGAEAFWNCKSLFFITLPEGLREIGESAFYRCNSLTKLTLPNSVTTIGERAFYKCSALTEVNFPTSLVSMGESVFRYCQNLVKVEIPNGITEIPTQTFQDADTLSAIPIPASIETIGSAPFANCDGLNHFYFEGDAPASVEATSINYGAPQPKAYVLPEHADSFGGIGADWYGLEVVTYDFYLIDSVQGRGRISGNARTYSSNSNVTLTAVPEAGSVFIGWRGDITSDTNPLSISMNANLVIEAVFVEQARYDRVAIQIDSDGDGLSNTFEATPDSNALNNLGFFSTSQMTDARPGSVMLQKTPQGDAMLSLQIERSRNLETWTQDEEDLLEVSIPLDQSREFLRFSMDTK